MGRSTARRNIYRRFLVLGWALAALAACDELGVGRQAKHWEIDFINLALEVRRADVCYRIPPDAVRRTPNSKWASIPGYLADRLFGEDRSTRLYFVRSACVFIYAIEHKKPAMCGKVQNPEPFWPWLSQHIFTEETCLQWIAEDRRLPDDPFPLTRIIDEQPVMEKLGYAAAELAIRYPELPEHQRWGWQYAELVRPEGKGELTQRLDALPVYEPWEPPTSEEVLVKSARTTPKFMDSLRDREKQAMERAFVGDWSAGEQLMREQLDIDATAEGVGSERWSFTASGLAIMLLLGGDYDTAEALFFQVRDLFKEKAAAEKGDWVPLASLYLMYSDQALARLYTAQGRLLEAERTYLHALDVSANLSDDEPSDVIRDIVASGLTLLFARQGRFDEAVRHADALLARRLRNGDDANTFELLQFAHLFEARGRVTDAEHIYRRFIDARHEEDTPSLNTLAAYANLAWLRFRQERTDETGAILLNALDVTNATASPELHKDYLRAHLAHYYVRTDRLDDAAPLYQALSKLEDSDQASEFARFRHQVLAGYAQKVGRHENALVHLQAAEAFRPTGQGFLSMGESVLFPIDERGLLELQIRLLHGLRDEKASAAEEAFVLAQRLRARSTAKAVLKMAARFAAKGDGLARIVREREALSDRLDRMSNRRFKAGRHGRERRAGDGPEGPPP